MPSNTNIENQFIDPCISCLLKPVIINIENQFIDPCISCLLKPVIIKKKINHMDENCYT